MADDKIVIPIMAQLDQLDGGLRAGERKIADATTRMEKVGGDGGGRIGRRLASGIVAGMGAIAIDRALEDGLVAFNSGKRGYELGVALADSFVGGLRSVPVAGALGEWIARGMDSAFGSGKGTVREQEARRQAERDRAADIADSTRRFADSLIDDTLSPTQRLERDLQRQRQELLGKIGNNPRLQRQIIPGIDKAIQDRIERERARDGAKNVANPASLIDTFSTPFGQVKIAQGQTITAKATEAIAGNTKDTARIAARIEAALKQFGYQLGFN